MIERKEPSSNTIGNSDEIRFAKFILDQSWEIAVAMVRFRVSPPTTEGERFTSDVAEARINLSGNLRI